jgi:NADPH-dependent 2,4-dienoyl-CoA reductase/sulfur reductase-like enzyme/ferredoxin
MSRVDLGMPTLSRQPAPEFRPYSELPRRIPRQVWWLLRVVPISVYLAVCVTLIGNPQRGLDVLWGLIIPWLPALFLIAPGVWRNLCPLAAMNQTPRLLGISRARTAPKWMRERGYVVGMLLFIGLVAVRRPELNTHGPLTAVLLLGTITAAFLGGLAIKGKGGWCSSVCPVLPVQRLYGQTPLIVSPNAHCPTCVGCAKNCYDFNPTAAYQADMHEVDPDWSAPRKAFAGAMPALVLGYFTGPAGPTDRYLAQLGTYLLAGIGSIFAINAITRIAWPRLAAAYAATAFALFYWWSPRTSVVAAKREFHVDLGFTDVPLRIAAITLAIVWFVRTLGLAQRFRRRSFEQASAKVSAERVSRVRADGDPLPEVTFEPEGLTVAAQAGMSLLDLAERSGVRIEAGCRMGMCGADPVRVLSGAECLTPIDEDERATLKRMGLADDVRLACSAQACGPVTISTDYQRTCTTRTSAGPITRTGPRLLVIGGGVAGVTAAETAREFEPSARISIVGRESYPLYNRMGISRVVHGRSGLQGLHLLPETWYDDHDIACWLNTEVSGLDLENHCASLATGETLEFDRLIIATGAVPVIPELAGSGLGGVFTLRTAQDAIAIRSFAQRFPGRRAVVSGAGLLGLEVAHALHQFGFAVTVLERNERLMPKLIDTEASAHLGEYLSALGISMRTHAEAAEVLGTDRVEQVRLRDGSAAPADLLAICVGVRPDLRLAAAAGLAIRAGILVDDSLRTSHPDVYAVGDVAEHAGRVPGLWPVAVAQAKVAGRNAVGGDAVFTPRAPVTLLKGVGISLVAAGAVEAGPDEHVESFEGPGTHAYLRLVLRDRTVVGALSLARPQDTKPLPEAIGCDRAEFLSRLKVTEPAASN